MEDNQTLANVQVSSRDILKIRLKKIHRTQIWLSKSSQLNVNPAYVSLFFTSNAYPELEERIERIIAREEIKIAERIRARSVQENKRTQRTKKAKSI